MYIVYSFQNTLGSWLFLPQAPCEKLYEICMFMICNIQIDLGFLLIVVIICENIAIIGCDLADMKIKRATEGID
ncbi:hypothetical protein VNO77_20080 [Canavalia gladiata]|uniref:Uncharacterized protein n=1 Tax=Canavalia gladiata TaxID=3824 RepID=A0AAN9LNP0_CANGL